ncbi:MAG: hypothetical protein WCG25_09795 [bacterium]
MVVLERSISSIVFVDHIFHDGDSIDVRFINVSFAASNKLFLRVSASDDVS